MGLKPRTARAASGDVAAYMATLVHRRKDEVEALRSVLLGLHEGITERIKWNAPSYCWRGEDRVTFRLNPNDRVQLVFHRGARTAPDARPLRVDDPAGLLGWLAADRAVVTFTDIDDVNAKATHLRRLVLAWMQATG